MLGFFQRVYDSSKAIGLAIPALADVFADALARAATGGNMGKDAQVTRLMT